MAKVIIISGASGSGKTSLIKSIIDHVDHVALSISHTTRLIRKGEIDGIDYHFCTESFFKEAIKNNNFLEYAQVFDNFYGTQTSTIMTRLAKGKDIIVEIDWQGAQQVRQQFPDAISIFIMPPSLFELALRLKKRGQDSQKIIDRRMQDALLEMSHYYEYDYIIINEYFKTALNELKSIITSQKLMLNTQINSVNQILN